MPEDSPAPSRAGADAGADRDRNGGSAGTVSHVLERAAAGLSWPLPDGLDGEALRERLYPGVPRTVERRANAFAAVFLMPKDGVRDALRNRGKGLPGRRERTVFDAAGGDSFESEIRSPAGSRRVTCKDVATVAHRFGVSYQAALHRLTSLRHVPRRESRDLLEQEGLGHGYLKALGMFDEVGEREPRRRRDRELRGGIAHLAVEACRRERISRGRVLELGGTLGIDGDLLLRLAEAARGE